MNRTRLAAIASVVALASSTVARAEDTWSDPFAGVRRLDRVAPAPWRVHALVVDLCASGVSLRATRSGERGQVVSSFGAGVGAQAAVNGDFYVAGYRPVGLAVGSGERWPDASDPPSPHGTLAMGLGQVYFSPEAEYLEPPPPWVSEALGYHPELVRDGVITNLDSGEGDPVCVRNPRTAVGLSLDRRTLIVAVVDGRQPGFSVGMTCAELARLMQELGSHWAVGLDGGGSSTMWIAGAGVVNSPSDGHERVVANHLAVYASGSGLRPFCGAKTVDLGLAPGWPRLSGYILDAFGHVSPFGIFVPAPPAVADMPGGAFELSRAIALRADGASGYVLDFAGALHAFGGAPEIADPGATWTTDLARALALRADGSSGYKLDAHGGVTAFGGAPSVETTRTWETDEARDLGLRSDGASGWVLDGHGGIHSFGGAPDVTPPMRWDVDFARSIAVSFDDTSGYVLDLFGGVHAFGGAVEIGTADTRFADYARSMALRPDAVSGLFVDASGTLHSFGNARAAHVAMARAGGVSGYVLDGWGGLTPFGDAPDPGVAASWPSWDIARAGALRPDGASGYIVDGWGGIHPFGGAPDLAGGPYTPDHDVARALVLRADGASGYLLDEMGGVHALGGAPAVSIDPPLAEGARARDLALRPDGASGYVLDGGGGLHAFGGAPAIGDAPPVDADGARALVLRADGSSGYVLDGAGALHAFGGAPDLGARARWPGWDVARDVVLGGDGAAGQVLDVYGRLHAFGGAPEIDADGGTNADAGTGPHGDAGTEGAIGGACSCRLARSDPRGSSAWCVSLSLAVALLVLTASRASARSARSWVYRPQSRRLAQKPPARGVLANFYPLTRARADASSGMFLAHDSHTEDDTHESK